MQSQDSVLNINNLKFGYSTSELLFNDLTLDIKRGKVTTILGANGCGKSTLFNLITKNLDKISGEILLDGSDIDAISLKDFAKQVAIVHQKNTAPADITVKKLVSYGRIPYRSSLVGKSCDTQEDERCIAWALDVTNTAKLQNRAVADLSGGQMQRVWIAMALAQDTDVLFLDEPTTFLDVRYQLQVLRLVRRLNEEFNKTVVMVLHDINQAMFYSDELIALSDGQVAAHHYKT